MLSTKTPDGDSAAAESSDNSATKKSQQKTRSIRQGLLRSLLTVLGLLLIVSAWLIDQVIERELYGRFDGELLSVARSLETLTLQEAHGVELHFSDAVMPKFKAQTKPDYFELKYAGGALIERSKSLDLGLGLAADTKAKSNEFKTFELKSGLGDSAVAFADVTLPDGRLGRLVRLQFQPGLGDSLDQEPMQKRPAPQQVELMVARDMDLLTGIEKRMHVSLIAVVIGLLAVTGVLVWWRVGRELNAIDRLATQAGRIGQSQNEPAMALAGVPQELMPLILRINESSESIARALDRERRWSRDLAHEMRTPIAELKTLLDVAQAFPNAYTPQQVQAQASQIAGEMDALVSTLLLMARVEGGLEQVSQQPIDISELCGAILAGIKDTDISQWTTQLENFPVVKSDAALVRMLLSNLIGNARSYAEPISEVYLKAASENGVGFFEIKNRAPHLQAADLAQMTQRFWRKSGNQENGVRSGLGLSIAQALCDILALKLTLNLDAEQFFSVRIDGWKIAR